MSIAQRIQEMLEQDPSAHPSTIATQLAVSEWEVVRQLPAELVTLLPAERAQALLDDLADWGPVTTIVESEGSIFEVKAPFPKGKDARGYYNLMG
ncbi:MAG: ChuX/HutX family heme-like substrate-binding protein, partial [Aeromonas jandaei]